MTGWPITMPWHTTLNKGFKLIDRLFATPLLFSKEGSLLGGVVHI